MYVTLLLFKRAFTNLFCQNLVKHFSYTYHKRFITLYKYNLKLTFHSYAFALCTFLPEAERRTWRSREGVWLPENIEVYMAILVTVFCVFYVYQLGEFLGLSY